MQINIIYWSSTGNTEKMANLIEQGAASAGATVNIKHVSSATTDDLNCDILALGCSSMGNEVLDDSEFEPFIDSIQSKVAGKNLFLFGSYDWGDGEWMRNFDERMEGAGATLAIPSLIVRNTPEGESEQECIEAGKSLVK